MGLSGAATAQQTVETVVVTGTHIASPNLQSMSPVIEATSTDIQIQGSTKVEDLLNQMPQVFAGQNATVSNGATGTSEVDLRGLGCDRTLVLIDGRRMPYGSMLDTCADLNQIPTQLVDRVEVLTGGASAIYGSDAVSGVVNFIMKKDFEGFQAEAQYGIYQHDNGYDGPGNLRAVIAGRATTNPSQFQLPSDSVALGAGMQFSGIMGVSSANGKGNITAYFSYRHNDPILEKNYDYSECALGNPSGSNWTCGGSSTSATGLFSDFTTFAYTLDTTGSGNTFRNFNGATDKFNYAPYNYFQRNDERYSAGVFGHYQASAWADVYTQLMYTDYSTAAQIAPSGDFGNTNAINCNNPELSTQEATAIGCTPAMIAAPWNAPLSAVTTPCPYQAGTCDYILRRNVEGGNRASRLRNTSFRALLGIKGSLNDDWSYDINGAYSRVQSSQIYVNDLSVNRLKNALYVVTDPNTGNPVCHSVLDGSDPNCVPWDIFKVGGVTQAALNYLRVPLIEIGSTTQLSLAFNLSGDLTKYGFVSPWAHSGVQVALGAEYRQDALESTTDTEFSTGDGAGQGGPTIGLSGATHVAEGYAEARIPVFEDMPFAQAASLDMSYRYSAYDRISTNTYGISADWQVINDFRLRGSYERAVRAPNVVDEFLPTGFNLTSDITTDPCGAGGYATLAECQSTPGAGSAPWYGSAGLNSPASQYNFLQGGNPNLKAEKANTFTAGFVFTPEAITGLNLSIDYWDIQMSDNIGAIAPSDVLYACYALGNAAQCANIHRTPGGLLWLGGGYIDSRNTNIGGSRTNGVDFSATYQFDLDDVGLSNAGALTASLNGTWLNMLTTNTGVGVVNACVNSYGFACGTPNPAWRHVFRLNWETPWNDLVVTGTWRFYGAVHQYKGDTTRIDYQWPSKSYFDLSAAMPVYTGTTLRVGVNNLFDSDPPISSVVGTAGNGNTYPQVYDAMGRYLFAAITLNM
ncbi:MAG: TonB-dependent receptor [Alphaproteobacteria bacterium]|nr:TonB-dependent receptor [Alphaproteobacteria bacterium]